MKIKHFKLSEFDCPTLPNSGVNMDLEFVTLLDNLRSRCGFPIIINSGYRTKEHNKKVGGSANSSHLRGLAVDVKVVGNFERFCIIKHAIALKVTRIGVYKTFIHLDVDKSLPPNVIWYE